MTSKDDSIFVQIASYRDPECQWTVKDLFDKADNPDRITVGICWQYDPEHDQAGFEHSSRVSQVRTIKVYAQDSQGVCWARRQTQTLWRGEDYTLVIDSHMRFARGWDSKMIKQLSECDADKPLISSNPASYTLPNNLESSPRPTIRRAHPFNSSGEMRCRGELLERAPPKPLNGAFIAAGSMFSRASVIDEVPYDPYLYFNQEEISYAARLYTHGWDVFSAREMLFYHLYFTKQSSGRNLHWRDHPGWQDLQNRGLARFNHLTGYEISQDPEVIKEIEHYGLGQVRTLEDYRDYCGVDLKNKTVSETGLRCLFIKDREKYLSRIYIPELDGPQAQKAAPVTTAEQSLAPSARAQNDAVARPQPTTAPAADDRIRYLPLEAGAFIPYFSAVDHDGKRREIHNYAGKNTALIFITNNELLYLAEFFACLRRAQKSFAQRQMHVVSIFHLSIGELSSVYEHYDVWSPIWADADGSIAASFGIEMQQAAKKKSYAFLCNRNLQVLSRYEFGNIENFMGDIIRDTDELAPKLEHNLVGEHAPVLVVPNVLDQASCQRLISYWQSEGERFEGKIGADENSNYSKSWKVRTDTHVTDELQTHLDELLTRNLFPELEKVTGLKVTRREDYKIGCYDGAKGGFFNQHRDNFEPGLAYRRYAMTLNLNDDFEGGELNFPEYGGGLYRPSAGTAVIFPCSLMHQANKVTTGQRYMLVSFFYGEQEAKQRFLYRQTKGLRGPMDEHKIILSPTNRQSVQKNDLSRFNNMPVQRDAGTAGRQSFGQPRQRSFSPITTGIPPGILVIENYLEPDFCKYLTDYADTVVGRKLKVLDNTKTSGSETVTMESKGRITEHVRIDGVLNELMPVFVDVYTQRLAPYYDVRFEWFERPQILRYPPGGLYNRHADSEHWVKETQSWVRAQDRDYSILLYLNEEFSGGEIAFVDFDFKLKPKRGMLVAFPADHRYQHAALPTTSGTRYVIVSWAAALGTPRVKERPPYAATYLNLPGSD